MTEIATNEELTALIASGATYAQVLQRVLENEDRRTAFPRQRSSLAARKAAFAKAVTNNDTTVLQAIRRRMKKYIGRIAHVQMDEPRVLTPVEAFELMGEHIDLVSIQEFLASRKDTIKELVFASMDAKLAAGGIDNPSAHNSAIPVAELHRIFKREGAGYSPPSLDEGKLRLLLGDDADKVFDEVEVPATSYLELDHERLIKLAQERPEVMEMIRESLVPGKERSARFVVRELTD